jgi:hypothetical protein
MASSAFDIVNGLPRSQGWSLTRFGDSLGALAAGVCAAHCALLPIVLALLPTLGVGVLASREFEFLYVAFATVLALLSLVQGYRRHRIYRALGYAVPGLLAVWAGVLVTVVHENVLAHAVVMTIGGTLIAVAHLVNLKLTHRHHAAKNCCPP